MKPVMKKALCIILVFATCLCCILAFSSCKREDPLPYPEDTSTEEKTVYYVYMEVKNYGNIIVKLDATYAPETVKNFVKLVRADFYDGLTFHRVIDNFMIQGGCPEGDGSGSASEKIPGEFVNNGHYNPLSHKRGVISMARPGNNMNGASCQFFICNATNSSVQSLDNNYASFGYVVEGMDVVDAITAGTAIYGDSNGTIANKKNQAVITRMAVILYEENSES